MAIQIDDGVGIPAHGKGNSHDRDRVFVNHRIGGFFDVWSSDGDDHPDCHHCNGAPDNDNKDGELAWELVRT
jgi:hypothetical protein